MIRVTASITVMVAMEPVDFRRQMDGLVAHCRYVLSTEVKSEFLLVPIANVIAQ